MKASSMTRIGGLIAPGSLFHSTHLVLFPPRSFRSAMMLLLSKATDADRSADKGTLTIR
jgi:hypothetical protein